MLDDVVKARVAIGSPVNDYPTRKMRERKVKEQKPKRKWSPEQRAKFVKTMKKVWAKRRQKKILDIE